MAFTATGTRIGSGLCRYSNIQRCSTSAEIGACLGVAAEAGAANASAASRTNMRRMSAPMSNLGTPGKRAENTSGVGHFRDGQWPKSGRVRITCGYDDYKPGAGASRSGCVKIRAKHGDDKNTERDKA